MAKQSTLEQFDSLMNDVNSGKFAPYYLLMGEEPYYIDTLTDAIAEKAVTPDMRDFNRIILYGPDVKADMVIGAARQFPMMGERLLVILKEAQAMQHPDDLASYLISPMTSTVLVICYKGKTVDKRTAFYKQSVKSGIVMESVPVPDYRISGWVESYIRGKGLKVNPEAAALIAENTGTSLQKIALEVDKLLKVLPEGTKEISVEDVETNVGISREYSAFELSKAFSLKDKDKIYRIALNFADSPKRYPIQLTIAALSSTFLKVLRYHSLRMKGADQGEIVAALGINPYFIREYETAARNYPLQKAMQVIGILKDYDNRSKSNLRGDSTDGDLLIEMVSRILDA
jgi:DNA polymerase III, delta subunit